MTSTDQRGRPPGIISSEVSGRTRRWLTAVPPALAALLACVTIFGLAWALIVPAFQAPDETAHFAYAQSLATRLALPGSPRRPAWSADQMLADRASNASILAFAVDSVTPPWTDGVFKAYLAQARRHPSQSNGGGPNSEAVNPPLFYFFSDLAYWASDSANLFGRLYAMRVWGVLLLLGNAVAGWLLAGEALGRRHLVQVACAAVCGLMPMETFIATSVNPDALMVPLWTFASWLGTRLIRRGWSNGNALALCLVVAAAILTKATSYALLPAALFSLVLAWRRTPASRRREIRKGSAGALAALAAPVLAWIAFTKSQGRAPINTVHGPSGAAGHSGFRLGGFISYLWEFYLPRLPFMTRLEPEQRGVYFVWLKQGWAAFGWLDVRLPRWAYPLLTGATAVIGLASAGILLVRRSAGHLPLLGFFALTLGALLLGLHLTDYRAIVAGEGALLQGRYLLPVIGLFGLAVALIVRQMPGRFRPTSAAVVLAALLLLQVLSLATVAKAYYT